MGKYSSRIKRKSNIFLIGECCENCGYKSVEHDELEVMNSAQNIHAREL